MIARQAFACNSLLANGNELALLSYYALKFPARNLKIFTHD